MKKNRIHRIFIDLDGVLADFFSRALEVHGCIHLKERWPAGEWDMAKVLGISKRQFWNRIDESEYTSGFWSQLDAYHWKNEIIELPKYFDVPFTIATSPSRDSACATSKVRWMRTHLGDQFHDYIIGKQKWLLANKNVLLIDDSDKNVDLFRQYGGNAILFPQIWNSEFSKCNVRLEFLLEQLNFFFE